ncbi:uncharacterized protein LOC114522407 [Dendronephthya gigantea]|uniref:uncharacterized protein LOC114522407 n=1 Tax=Dendronephthya gigantea TaxID=151771 RepID=UPI00106A5B59|nr:uncharacterized protein LOC114522407 [Dendronephthya gigantea]
MLNHDICCDFVGNLVSSPCIYYAFTARLPVLQRKCLQQHKLRNLFNRIFRFLVTTDSTCQSKYTLSIVVPEGTSPSIIGWQMIWLMNLEAMWSVAEKGRLESQDILRFQLMENLSIPRRMEMVMLTVKQK